MEAPPLTTSAEDQAAVAALKQAETAAPAGGSSLEALNSVEKVEIDVGTFKYVLIEAKDPVSQEWRQLVRGVLGAPYHVDAARPTVNYLKERGVNVDVLGGGRIRHIPESKRIEVFGFSYGFGPANHECTKRLILEEDRFKDYDVEITKEGY